MQRMWNGRFIGERTITIVHNEHVPQKHPRGSSPPSRVNGPSFDESFLELRDLQNKESTDRLFNQRPMDGIQGDSVEQTK